MLQYVRSFLFTPSFIVFDKISLSLKAIFVKGFEAFSYWNFLLFASNILMYCFTEYAAGKIMHDELSAQINKTPQT